MNEKKRSGAKMGTVAPVIGELYYGIGMSDSGERNRPIMDRGIVQFKIWPFDFAAAIEYGRLAAYLKRAGRPIQKIDIMIAAVALTIRDCTVVSTDGDLSAVPGLAVENWCS